VITAKEEFVGCEKYVRAYKLGRGEAIMMWWALKCYAAKNPTTEGFIPDEDIDGLIGAPRNPRKALQALVECGGLLRDGNRGAGLVDPVDGGWQLHDYLDHAPPPEEVELRREKAALKKRRQREEHRRQLELLRAHARGDSSGDNEGHPGGHPGDIEGDKQGDKQGDIEGTPLRGARPPTRVQAQAPARPQPNPTQPDPSVVAERWAALASSDELLDRIPPDLAIDEELRAAAVAAGVHPDDIDERFASLKAGPIGGGRGVFAGELRGYVRRQFGNWKTWGETKRAKLRSTRGCQVDPDARLQRQADRVQMLREQEAEQERMAAAGGGK